MVVSEIDRPPIEEVVRRNEHTIMQVPGVTGVGVSHEGLSPERSVIVIFRSPDSEHTQQLPAELEGWPTQIRPPLSIG
jgi:hypothetical protein